MSGYSITSPNIPTVINTPQPLYQNPRGVFFTPPHREPTSTLRTQFDIQQNQRTCSCVMKEGYHAPYGLRTQFDQDLNKRTCPTCKSWEGYSLPGNNWLSRQDPNNASLSALARRS